MTKKTWTLLIFIFLLVGLCVLLAIDSTRPMVFSTAGGLWIAIQEGVGSITGSAWWQIYGWPIIGVGGLIIGMGITTLYYKGKFKLWKYGIQDSAKSTGWQTTPPAQTPTPITPPATAPTPVEPKKESA